MTETIQFRSQVPINDIQPGDLQQDTYRKMCGIHEVVFCTESCSTLVPFRFPETLELFSARPSVQ